MLAHETPGNTLLDPTHHVDDAGLVSFAQKNSLNRLIAPAARAFKADRVRVRVCKEGRFPVPCRAVHACTFLYKKMGPLFSCARYYVRRVTVYYENPGIMMTMVDAGGDTEQVPNPLAPEPEQ